MLCMNVWMSAILRTTFIRFIIMNVYAICHKPSYMMIGIFIEQKQIFRVFRRHSTWFSLSHTWQLGPVIKVMETTTKNETIEWTFIGDNWLFMFKCSILLSQIFSFIRSVEEWKNVIRVGHVTELVLINWPINLQIIWLLRINLPKNTFLEKNICCESHNIRFSQKSIKMGENPKKKQLAHKDMIWKGTIFAYCQCFFFSPSIAGFDINCTRYE